MKIFTKGYTTFFVLASILTLIFRVFLSKLILNQSFTMVWVIAAIYGLLIFTIRFVSGERDKHEFSLTQSFLRWNGGTFIVWGLVSYLWMFLGNPAPSEKLNTLNTAMIIWASISIIIYFILKYYTIKGVDKSEIFE